MNDDFRKYVWYLRFEKNEGCGVNGIDSHTALALRVINDLDICVTNWINSVSDNLLGGSSEVCKHLRNLLSVDSAERKDFLEFWARLYTEEVCNPNTISKKTAVIKKCKFTTQGNTGTNSQR